VADEKGGQRFWLEVDGCQRRVRQGNELEAIVAAGGVAELRAGAITGAGGPGPCPGEVEVLAFGAVVEDVQEAVNLGRRGGFLSQFAG
jgi:hypothetical protein